MLNFTYVSVVAKSAEKIKYCEVSDLGKQLPEAAPPIARVGIGSHIDANANDGCGCWAIFVRVRVPHVQRDLVSPFRLSGETGVNNVKVFIT